MARTAGETGDSQIWAKTRRQLLGAGYRLDGDRVLSGPHGMMETPAPAPPVPAAPPPVQAAPPPVR